MNKKWNKRKEHYYQMAKKEKYRSRSSYKLIQLNKRFKIIKNGDYVVDLGAAPGGWSQVALDVVGDNGFVLGVDLLSIKPFKKPNFLGIREDLRDIETVEKIKRLLGREVDVVLSDASVKLSGIKDMDQLRSMEIAGCVLKIGSSILKRDGKLILKAFQGEKYVDLLKKIRENFRMVKTSKPPSSRKGSREMYIIASGFKRIARPI